MLLRERYSWDEGYYLLGRSAVPAAHAAASLGDRRRPGWLTYSADGEVEAQDSQLDQQLGLLQAIVAYLAPDLIFARLHEILLAPTSSWHCSAHFGRQAHLPRACSQRSTSSNNDYH